MEYKKWDLGLIVFISFIFISVSYYGYFLVQEEREFDRQKIECKSRCGISDFAAVKIKQTYICLCQEAGIWQEIKK